LDFNQLKLRPMSGLPSLSVKAADREPHELF